MEKSSFTLMLYFGLMFISWFFMQVSQYTVVRSTKDENNWEYVLYTSQVLFCLCIILNIIVWRSNPGFVEGDPSLKFVTLLDSFEPKSLCPDCQIIKTPRSRHCNLCKRCVDRFDHHCPWVNNCIGKNNFAYFYTFVFLQSTYLILLVAITVKCKYILKVSYFVSTSNYCFTLKLHLINDQLEYYFVVCARCSSGYCALKVLCLSKY